ncbi:hypothetical protein GCM10023083_78770 [Streptomyces phyllanthi]
MNPGFGAHAPGPRLGTTRRTRLGLPPSNPEFGAHAPGPRLGTTRRTRLELPPSNPGSGVAPPNPGSGLPAVPDWGYATRSPLGTTRRTWPGAAPRTPLGAASYLRLAPVSGPAPGPLLRKRRRAGVAASRGLGFQARPGISSPSGV